MAILLPPAKQQFFDANGVVCSMGTVTLYVPGTTSLKDSWQDSGQSQLNTNPIALDIGGYATIYGNGSYRQVVKDRLGNQVWDRVVDGYNTTPGNRIAFSTYANMAAASTFPANTTGEVPTTDAGTHTDPVVGGTVSNSGVFRYSASPAGWQRMFDFPSVGSQGPGGPQGNPGVNGGIGSSAGNAALFTAAAGMTIGAGITSFRTSGYSAAGIGGAEYIYDAAVNAAYVTAYPTSAFLAGDGRGFRLNQTQQINVKMFGALGDGVASDGAAFAAAFAYLKAISLGGYAYGKGSPRLYVPAGVYLLGTTTLDFTHTLILEGDNVGDAGGMTTVLKWSPGATALRIQANNTTGATGTQTAATSSGSAAVIRNLALFGGFAASGNVEGEYHGVHLRARASIENCYISGFQGDGIYSYVTAGSGGATEGNANNIFVRKVWIDSCRNNLFVRGADVNAGVFIGVNSNFARAWNIFDSSFLGNTYIGCHTSGGGTSGPYPSNPPSTAYQTGNRYYVQPGQAVGASTNAPSGTTADNTWWGWWAAAGAAQTPAWPQWVSGTTYREGGSYKTDNNNAANVFIGCYAESDQPQAQFVYPTIITGGLFGSGVKGTAGYGTAVAGGLMTFANGIGALNPNLYGMSLAPDAIHINRSTDDYTLEWFNNDLAYTVLRSSNSAAWAYRMTGELTSANVGKRRMDFPNGYGLADKKRTPATVAPTTARVVGDIDENIAPTATTPTRWITTAAGTPGTQIADYPNLRADPATGIGYLTGAGGTVTQATSKATGVTLNKVCGQITLNNASLAANTAVSFTLTNSAITATDVIRINTSGAATPGSYLVQAEAPASGSCTVSVRNMTAGALGEALVLNFAIIKAVAA